MLFCLIGILELEFHSPEEATTDDYGDYFESSIYAGAAAWAITQLFIFPFFLYNCIIEKTRIGLLFQGTIWALCVVASFIGIVYMNIAFCSQYTLYWIINIFIFTPIQILLDGFYALGIKFLCFADADKLKVIEKNEKIDKEENTDEKRNVNDEEKVDEKEKANFIEKISIT